MLRICYRMIWAKSYFVSKMMFGVAKYILITETIFCEYRKINIFANIFYRGMIFWNNNRMIYWADYICWTLRSKFSFENIIVYVYPVSTYFSLSCSIWVTQIWARFVNKKTKDSMKKIQSKQNCSFTHFLRKTIKSSCCNFRINTNR